MKTYEDYSQSPDGWNVTSTLELKDDGRFSYSEGWTDYTNASLSGGAGGTWRRDEGAIIFRAERVYGPMYFPWAEGQELIARLRDGALDFGGGWTLHPPTPRQEYTAYTPLSNDGAGPLTLVLEPWGIQHTLAPGERVEVIARGPWWEGEPKVERRGDELVYDGRNGSWATIVPQPPLPPLPSPKPSAPPRAAVAETNRPAPKPRIKPAAKPPVKPPAPPPAKAPAEPFKPRAPSPELAALLRRWVEELPPDGPGRWIKRLCKENDAIPLDCTQFDLWVLTTDGQVLCIDYDSFAQRAEPVTNSEEAYGLIALGAQTHPELLELLPPERIAGMPRTSVNVSST